MPCDEAHATLTRPRCLFGHCGTYRSCQISTRFPVRIGISKRFRFGSYPKSAGLGTPVMIFVPCVLSNRVIEESAQLDTTTFPPTTPPPSHPPGPPAVNGGRRYRRL